MNDHKLRLLRQLTQRPRTLRDLTHCYSLNLTQVSNAASELYASQLEQEGYVYTLDKLLYITGKGRDYLRALDEEKPSPTTTDSYTGPNWNLRAGSQDFLRFQSKGLG